MSMVLSEFEQHIDEKILKRGLSYFKGGAISDFSEISNGEYEAIVSGTEEYTVQLEINNNTIVEHNCDCPYDMGPVCKHVVAVIFHIQQDVLELNQPSVSKPRKKKTKSVSQQVKELLKEISHNELIEFVQENSKKDKKFRNYFLATSLFSLSTSWIRWLPMAILCVYLPKYSITFSGLPKGGLA